ncbi:MAG: hypothetical protein Q8S04_02160 [Bacteroidales bacterium]|nr:hypothetical protein [Bacteroidales bacterium]
MKNTITIIVPIILGLILSSCGTTTRYASSGYEDAIYQRPSTNGYIVVNTENDSKIELLKGKTKESNRVIINGKVVEAAYVDENGNVNIDIDDMEEKTYLILNPGESFEERLTKFENPQYQINITYSYMDYYNPWFWDFGYSSFWRMSRMHNMYSPWYSYFMSPWFGSGFYGYNQYYMDPFAGIGYFWWNRYGLIRSPWESYYSSWYYPGESYGYWFYNWNDPERYRYTSSRDFYYGRRESARSNTTPGSRAVVSGGSYTRQAARVEQVRGARFYTGDISSSESQYRRDSRFEGYGSTTNSQTREVSGQRRGNTEATSRVERESSSRRSSEITRNSSTRETTRTNTEVNRGSNNTQSSVRRSNNEGTGNSGTVNRSSGTVNRSSGSSTTGTSTTRGSSQRRDDVISSSNYRPSENQRSSSSNNNTFTRGSSSTSNSSFYNSNSASRSSVSSPPASSAGSSSSSSNTSSSSSSSGSSSTSSTSSSGSSYRR